MSFYPFLKNVNIYAADDEFFDRAGLSDALAATDAKGLILIRRNLSPALFRHALFHECEHIMNPLYSESEVEYEARKKDGFGYRVNAFNNFSYELKQGNRFSFKVNVSASDHRNKNGKLPAYLV
jgi:hypothetical protein